MGALSQQKILSYLEDIENGGAKALESLDLLAGEVKTFTETVKPMLLLESRNADVMEAELSASKGILFVFDDAGLPQVDPYLFVGRGRCV